MGTNPIPVRIRDEERYKPYLVDWLRGVQQAGWVVHLFTVRNEDRKKATLESILTKADWQPDDCWFKAEEIGGPPEVKSAYLDRLIPKLAPLPAPFRKCVSLAGLKMSSSSMGSSSNLH